MSKENQQLGTTKTINFDPAKLKRLKAAYKRAVEQGVDSFMFEDGEWVVGYAKYAIEYLEGQFNGR